MKIHFIVADSTAFERVPCVIHPDNYMTALALARAIRTVIESEEEGPVKRFCGRGRSMPTGGEEGWAGVIEAADIPKEELHKYMKKRPRRE
jgi:hypothetical protein